MNKSSQANTDFQARLQELRVLYAESLPEKMAAIDDQWKSLEEEWDWKVVAVLHQMVHSLAGSGGSFGYAELGMRAREIEIEIKSVINTKSIPAVEKWIEIVTKINNLQSATYTASSQEKEVSFHTHNHLNKAHKSIYLLEDPASEAEDLKLQLDRYGYRVDLFSTVETLTKAIQQAEPLALIVDVVLGDDQLAGISLVRDIRGLHGEVFPILFLSSCNDFEIRLEAVRAGGDAYFVKPVGIASFVDHLETLTQLESKDSYRVLIMDEEENLAAHYALVLNQAGMDAVSVNNPRKLLSAMANFRPELILMDLYMPTCSGLELAKMIRQQESYLGMPVVFLSSESDDVKEFAAMRMGGDGFLTKPISNSYLTESVTLYAKRARLVNNMMMQDGLTQLLKHAKIKEILNIEVSRAQSSSAEMAYAMVDIDNFKSINDTYGHLMGDHVIKGLARLLKHRLRKSDIVGRYGGDEFAIILPDCDLSAAVEIIDQLRISFEQLCFTHDGVSFSVTFSAGIALYPDCNDAQQLAQTVDDALCRAKAGGRNCIVQASTKDVQDYSI